jgi:2-keto-4-pentenoate hydratase/2-oxohepta-3-ene-1,7-dioic acid hydratase in catechol pathway
VSAARYFRVATQGGPAWARQEGDRLRLLDRVPWEQPGALAQTLPLASARLLAPATPSKIVAIGRNYADHARERGKPLPAEPLIFLKPPSAVVGPGAPVRIPPWAGRVEHEAELAVVIGREAKDLPDPETALAHVLGATCANDVTARELQEKDVQFTRAKGFDTFCPLGPCLATGLDLGRLSVRARVNGEPRQDGSTADMIFPVARLVLAVSRVMTLLPGDIICTGTPAGVSALRPGDEVEVEVEGVGILRNPVVSR